MLVGLSTIQLMDPQISENMKQALFDLFIPYLYLFIHMQGHGVLLELIPALFG